MRPLPIEALPSAPSFVLGLAMVRGTPTPVLDVGSLVGCAEPRATTRFVTLHLGDRSVALAVEAVLGVRTLDGGTLVELPPLLGASSEELALALGRLDDRLLLVLRTAKLVPEEVWQAIPSAGWVS
jgi:purine-binding chemotaxis protein CheW